MIAALPLADVMEKPAPVTCAWPECPDAVNTHGFCRKHALRVERGRDVGCETPWEQLVAAALQLAAAETDVEFDRAALRLKASAIGFRKVARPRAIRKGKGRTRATEVERDVARARAQLEAKGVVVGDSR